MTVTERGRTYQVTEIDLLVARTRELFAEYDIRGSVLSDDAIRYFLQHGESPEQIAERAGLRGRRTA